MDRLSPAQVSPPSPRARILEILKFICFLRTPIDNMLPLVHNAFRMSKVAQALCPFCKHLVIDPSYSSHRFHSRILRCENCHNNLEWQRGYLNPLAFVVPFILLLPALYRFAFGYSSVPASLRKLVSFMADAAIPLLLVGVCLEVAEFFGFVRPRLRVTARQLSGNEAGQEGAIER